MTTDNPLMPDQILDHAIECCDAWEPDARLIGNVRAEDLGNFLKAYRAALQQPVTDAERQEAFDWFNSLGILSMFQFKHEKEKIDIIRRALSPPASQTIELIKLKKTIPCLCGPNKVCDEESKAHGWNAAIDHITAEYDLTKKP